VEDLVRQLVKKANGNVALAEYGIVYLDEIDKITMSSGNTSKDVSGRGVQSNLLKLLEDTEVALKAPWDIQSQLKGFLGSKKSETETINTKHILFIVSGAFEGLEEIVKKRVEGSHYGFRRNTKTKTNENALHQSATEDFKNYGFEAEFIARFPVRVFCNELSEKNLFEILKYSELSILRQYLEAFKLYGIDLRITDSALKELSRQAKQEKTGARGLLTILEQSFREFKFELPSTPVSRLLITPAVLKDPQKTVKKLCEDPAYFENACMSQDIDDFEKQYLQDQGVNIVFQNEVRAIIYKRSKQQNEAVYDICTQLLAKLEYGWRMVKAKNPKTQIQITKEALTSPDSFLEHWIKESVLNTI